MLLDRYVYRVPNKWKKEIFKKRWLLPLYLKYKLKKHLYRKYFSQVENVVLFIGYPRSGHSLIGSILDAHPNIIIGHEVDVLYLIDKGLDKYEIFSIIYDNSKAFSKIGRGWSGYNYTVENQYQGRFKKLKVVGDKMGGMTSSRLKDNNQLIDSLQSRIQIPVKFIHHIRNPFDNISTMCIKDNNNIVKKEVICDYFNMVKTVVKVKKKVSEESILDVWHEDFINNPENNLKRLLNFLGVKVYKDYIRESSKIIVKNESKTRYKIQWNNKDIKYVTNEKDKYDFLKRYNY